MGSMKQRNFQTLEDLPGTKEMAASGPNGVEFGSRLWWFGAGQREVADMLCHDAMVHELWPSACRYSQSRV
jgi:hypothetical protein